MARCGRRGIRRHSIDCTVKVCLHEVEAETVQTIVGFVIGQGKAVLKFSGHLCGYVLVNGRLSAVKGKRLLWLLPPGAGPFLRHYQESFVSVNLRSTW